MADAVSNARSSDCLVAVGFRSEAEERMAGWPALRPWLTRVRAVLLPEAGYHGRENCE